MTTTTALWLRGAAAAAAAPMTHQFEVTAPSGPLEEVNAAGTFMVA